MPTPQWIWAERPVRNLCGGDQDEAYIARLLSQNVISKREVGNGFFIRAKNSLACDSTAGISQI